MRQHGFGGQKPQAPPYRLERLSLFGLPVSLDSYGQRLSAGFREIRTSRLPPFAAFTVELFLFSVSPAG